MKNRKYFIISLLMASVLFTLSASAQWVIHPGLIKQLGNNVTYKLAMHAAYGNTLNDIKDARQKVLKYSIGIETVQQTIYRNLTNVDDAIRGSKFLKTALEEHIPNIFNNLSKATKLAAKHPYLAPYAVETATIIMNRVTNLKNEIHRVILADNPKVLINQAQRDALLNDICSELAILDGLTSGLVTDFWLYDLGDALDKVIPYKTKYYLDKNIVNDIMMNFKL